MLPMINSESGDDVASGKKKKLKLWNFRFMKYWEPLFKTFSNLTDTLLYMGNVIDLYLMSVQGNH